MKFCVDETFGRHCANVRENTMPFSYCDVRYFAVIFYRLKLCDGHLVFDINVEVFFRNMVAWVTD